MADSFEAVFDRLLEVTAVFNIPIKAFTFYIILTRTTSDRRHESHFILNVMVWNFIGNLIFTFLHPYPMFPATCYRLDGPFSRYTNNETFGHVIFTIIFASILNCALALSFLFPYRYVVFAFPEFAAKIRPIWVYAFCGSLHVAFTLILAFIINLWAVGYDDYSAKSELPERNLLYCFNPTGFGKMLFIGFFLSAMVVVSTLIITFSSLLYCDITKFKNAVHKATVRLQQKILLNLFIFTNVIMVFGGIPMVFNVLLIAYPHFPRARHIESIVVVVVLNHGTISALVTLALFQSYRDAVRRIFRGLRQRVAGFLRGAVVSESRASRTETRSNR